MIFSVGDHIQQIIHGQKTQTRRKSDWYQVGRTYSIQPCRTCKGIPEGRIQITNKVPEYTHYGISGADAIAEGLYEPGQFEQLYSRLNPGWKVRWAYTFRFVPAEEAGAE